MNYLVSVIDTRPGTPDQGEMPAIGAFNERLRAAGHLVYGGGLESPDSATVVDSRGGAPIVTDGPFLESKEFLAGLWIWEADDLDAALELAEEASRVCNRRIEVRPFAGVVG